MVRSLLEIFNNNNVTFKKCRTRDNYKYLQMTVNAYSTYYINLLSEFRKKEKTNIIDLSV